jgi:hypothetical protein
LIQIHRDSFKLKAAKDMRRNMKCYLRLCGSLANGNDAKVAAEAQITICEIKMKRTKSGSEPLDVGLEWKRFNGYENLPLQHTDHFFILCRSVPVEYCSFTPESDLLEAIFPPPCKLKGQKYACVSVNDLKRQQGAASTNPNKSDLLETLTPLYTREIACVSEVHAVTHTKIESLRYAVLALGNTADNQSTTSTNTSLLVVPMYAWHPITEEMIATFSCSDYSASVKNDADNRRKLIDEPEKVFLSSKAATDELKVALQGFGVGATQHHIAGNRSIDDDISISGDAQAMLLRDIHIRSAVDEANKRYAHMHNLKNARPDGVLGSKERNKKTQYQAEKTIAELEEEKKQAVSALIAARSRVLSLNDELCHQERNHATGAAQEKHGPGLGRRRVELFDALQSAPSLKTVTKMQAADRQVARLARQNTSDHRSKKSGSGGTLPPLKQKLDVLDDSLFLSSTS